jgi:hypothetical protein
VTIPTDMQTAIAHWVLRQFGERLCAEITQRMLRYLRSLEANEYAYAIDKGMWHIYDTAH